MPPAELQGPVWEGAIQLVSDRRNVDAGDSSPVAGGLSNTLGVCPGEAALAQFPAKVTSRPINGRKGQEGVLGSQSTRQTNRRQSIETI
jgi:hypothetical protein